MARTSCDIPFTNQSGLRIPGTPHSRSHPATKWGGFGTKIPALKPLSSFLVPVWIPSKPRFSMIPTSWQCCLPKAWAQQSLAEPFSPQPLLSAPSALTQLLPQQLLSCLCQHPFIQWTLQGPRGDNRFMGSSSSLNNPTKTGGKEDLQTPELSLQGENTSEPQVWGSFVWDWQTHGLEQYKTP